MVVSTVIVGIFAKLVEPLRFFNLSSFNIQVSNEEVSNSRPKV